MATNFPGSQDSFTNPTSSDTLDSPDHAAQHTNVNDAVEAIELALLDGAPLKIDDTNERVGIGTTSPDDKLHVVGDVTIEVSDDGSAAQPEVTLHRGSSSPADGDYLGQVKFSGRNDNSQTVNYAKITGKISDASDTTEDGLIEIANIKAGSQSIGYRFTSTDLKLINDRGLQVDGDVGIGTTAPDNKLHVQLAGTSQAPSSVPTTHMIIADAADNDDAGVAVYSANTGKGYLRFGDSDASAVAGFSYDHATNELKIRTNGSDRWTMDSSGNLTSANHVTANSGGADGGIVVGQAFSSSYVGLRTAGMSESSGNEYILISDGTNTFISSGSGGSTRMRGPANDSGNELRITDTQNLFSGATYVDGDEVWHRGDLRGGSTSGTTDTNGYLSFAHGLGKTPDFAFVGARLRLSSDNDSQLVFPITAINSSNIQVRAYEVDGSGNSGYNVSTIRSATIYIYFICGDQ